jgi:hypothetical protein
MTPGVPERRLDERAVEAAAEAIQRTAACGLIAGFLRDPVADELAHVALAAYFAALDPDDIKAGAVHLDICPECGEAPVSHGMDPPNFCTHEYEHRVPELYVPLRNLAALGLFTPDTEEPT